MVQENIIVPGWQVSSLLTKKLPPYNPSLVLFLDTETLTGNEAWLNIKAIDKT